MSASINATEIQNIFFEAMVNGYASGAKGTPVHHLPGSKQIVSKLGDWKVTDMWVKNEKSGKSSGMTVIFYHQAPVWSMSHEGWYPNDAVPFLKVVLERTYQYRQFAGCRGLNFAEASVVGECLHYTNVFSGDFANFWGDEQIIKRKSSGTVLRGYHQYRGGLLGLLT